jgi:pimeloyl-ACP methyl ester carboxylesterase
MAPQDVWYTLGDVRLHGLDWGGSDQATPIILLHGVGGNAWVWDAVAPRLREALGDAYRVVAIDQRGHGDSDKPEAYEVYAAEQVGKDVLGVQQALGGKPMILVGHSRGGWVSAFIAGRWPDRVERVVLVDPARIAFASKQDADEFYRPVLAALGPFKNREAAIASAIQHDPHARWTPERERWYLQGFNQQPDGSLVGKIPPWVVDRLRRAREEKDVIGPLVHHINMPVLLLVATKASEARRQQKLEYCRRIPHARVEFVDGTHYLHLDDPDRVAKLITGFVREE